MAKHTLNKTAAELDDHLDETSAVIALFTNYVKTHNSSLNFAGVKTASDPTPTSPSQYDAWIMYTAGTWQGVDVEVGDIVYYDEATYKKQTRYSINDLRTYII